MRNNPVLNIHADKEQLAKKLAVDLVDHIQRLVLGKEIVCIALSGGSTPTLLFRELVKINPDIPWKKLKIFWVDERCVPPNHEESNFGVAQKELFAPLSVPETNLFRIRGEQEPALEAKRYEDEILDNVSVDLTFPVFDIVLLGMGEDGHTASIFPNQMDLWSRERLCAVAVKPQSEQMRVTFTGHLINAAQKVIFLVSGSKKANVIRDIILKNESSRKYPASLVNPQNGSLEWYMDRDAASLLV